MLLAGLLVSCVGGGSRYYFCKRRIKWSELAQLKFNYYRRFVVPTTIAPRYGEDPFAISSNSKGDKINESLVYGTPEYTFSMSVSLECSTPILSLSSPSHHIEVTMGSTPTSPADELTPTRAGATLALNDAFLDKDFVLVVKARVWFDLRQWEIENKTHNEDVSQLGDVPNPLNALNQ